MRVILKHDFAFEIIFKTLIDFRSKLLLNFLHLPVINVKEGIYSGNSSMYVVPIEIICSSPLLTLILVLDL